MDPLDTVEEKVCYFVEINRGDASDSKKTNHERPSTNPEPSPFSPITAPSSSLINSSSYAHIGLTLAAGEVFVPNRLLRDIIENCCKSEATMTALEREMIAKIQAVLLRTIKSPWRFQKAPKAERMVGIPNMLKILNQIHKAAKRLLKQKAPVGGYEDVPTFSTDLEITITSCFEEGGITMASQDSRPEGGLCVTFSQFNELVKIPLLGAEAKGPYASSLMGLPQACQIAIDTCLLLSTSTELKQEECVCPCLVICGTVCTIYAVYLIAEQQYPACCTLSRTMDLNNPRDQLEMSRWILVLADFAVRQTQSLLETFLH